MKKLIYLFIISFSLFSCYDDYIKDFDNTAVYFPHQLDVRTFVVGEGLKIEVGVALGGIMDNTQDREVEYQLDNSLLNADNLSAMQSASNYIKNSVSSLDTLLLLPSSYYSISDNSKFVIKAGEHSGTVTIEANSSTFLADTATIMATYALPMRIVRADADSVLSDKDYAVIGLKYENMLFGNYWHGGETEVQDASGNVINTIKYYTTIPSPNGLAWELTTVGPQSLVSNGVSNVASSSNPEMKLTLNGDQISIESVDGATYEVMPDGASTFNNAKLLQDRKLFLNYKYQDTDGNWYFAKDTLTFRNRIRDGVNEWQDENPENYN